MRYRVLYEHEVIGTTDLATCDPSMGVIYGDFIPTTAYERVRHVFRLYATAGTVLGNQDEAKLNAYYAARDALDLRIESGGGFQCPISTVHVEDLSVELGEYRVMVWTDDVGAFETCA
jgi:hypothetical protein